MRIMTFNVRCQTENDGTQQFIYRVDFLCDTIERLHPDVIGLQEIRPAMRRMMIQRLPAYAFVGGGRAADRLGEIPCIAFRQENYLLEHLETEILSLYPHVPGSRYGLDQSSCPRAMVSCDLMPADGGTPFRVMNIHTDHVGVRARELEIAQLLRSWHMQQALRPMPTFILGDLNALPDAPEMQLLYEELHLKDLSQALPGTFHGYDKADPREKIDYIFASDEVRVHTVRAIHEKRGDLFLSDHDPILADVEMPGASETV